MHVAIRDFDLVAVPAARGVLGMRNTEYSRTKSNERAYMADGIAALPGLPGPAQASPVIALADS